METSRSRTRAWRERCSRGHVLRKVLRDVWEDTDSMICNHRQGTEPCALNPLRLCHPRCSHPGVESQGTASRKPARYTMLEQSSAFAYYYVSLGSCNNIHDRKINRHSHRYTPIGSRAAVKVRFDALRVWKLVSQPFSEHSSTESTYSVDAHGL